MATTMDPALKRAFYLAGSDIIRQAVFKKGSVNSKKALVVGGASFVSDKFLRSFVDSLLSNVNMSSPELQLYLSELLGISGALWVMKEAGVVSKGDIEASGDRSGDFMGAVKLALTDLVIAYVIEMVMAGTYSEETV